MSDHTPGPWWIAPPLFDGDVIYARPQVKGRRNEVIAMGIGNKADAYLIAAAPEMKDLLWDAWQDLNALSNGDQSCDARYEATETMEKIMSLLRRIEGEEETE